LKDQDLHNFFVSSVQPAEQIRSLSALRRQCDSERKNDSSNISFTENCEDPPPWDKRLSTAHWNFL